MKRLLPILLGFLLSQGAWAFGDYNDNSVEAKAKAAASAKAGALAVSVPIMVLKSSPNATIEGAEAPNIPPVVASANAHQPSAQCRYGLGAQFGVQEFGLGLSTSQWDEICGLWMAAQLTEGEASNQAATAAYCLTFKKAGVSNATCADWDNGQNMAMAKKVEQGEHRGQVVFGGSGSGGWN